MRHTVSPPTFALAEDVNTSDSPSPAGHTGAKPKFDGFPEWTDKCNSTVRKHLSREVYLMCENR